MTPEQAQTFIRGVLDYQDPETGLRLVHLADDFVEPMNLCVGNANIVSNEEVVGQVIFSLHLDKNAFELSRGDMDESVVGQGVGTRYLPFVYEKMREAGVRYIFATNTTEIAANMYRSAGWTEGLSDLDLAEGSFGLDLTA